MFRVLNPEGYPPAVSASGMAPALDEMAVAIDGEIYAQPGYQPVRAESEVHLLPRIAGG